MGSVFRKASKRFEYASLIDFGMFTVHPTPYPYPRFLQHKSQYKGKRFQLDQNDWSPSNDRKTSSYRKNWCWECQSAVILNSQKLSTAGVKRAVPNHLKSSGKLEKILRNLLLIVNCQWVWPYDNFTWVLTDTRHAQQQLGHQLVIVVTSSSMNLGISESFWLGLLYF